ncbi:MAG: general secretion pathway protein G [Mariniblastus sp.]|jgi:general secretion pathway protein G
MNMKTNKRKSQSGFTILELVIVLVILVAILAIVGPRLMRSQQKADIKLTQIQIGTLETTLKEYAVDMKRFPSTDDGLSALLRQPMDGKKSSHWSGPYLDGDNLPVDAWENEYIYQLGSDGAGQGRPIIVSKGPDGELNTDDDIFNFRPVGEGDLEENDVESDTSDEPMEDLESVDLGDDFEN